MLVEQHFANVFTGHVIAHGHDCWCEPSIYWHHNSTNIFFMIVVHHDFSHHARPSMVAFRSSKPDWITDILNEADPPAQGQLLLPPPPDAAPPTPDDDEDEIIFEAEFDLDEEYDDSDDEPDTTDEQE